MLCDFNSSTYSTKVVSCLMFTAYSSIKKQPRHGPLCQEARRGLLIYILYIKNSLLSTLFLNLRKVIKFIYCFTVLFIQSLQGVYPCSIAFSIEMVKTSRFFTCLQLG